MLNKSLLCALIIFLLCPFICSADKSSIQVTPGLILNAPNILLELKEYQKSPSGVGGIGIKLKELSLAQILFDLRCLLGLHLRDGFNSYRIDLGIATEFPFFKKSQISPYWGVYSNFGFDYLRTSLLTNPIEYNTNLNFVISVGPMLGVEVFITEFLSFFAEYNLAADFVINQRIPSAAATETDMSFTLNTGLGNGAMLGFVIYFKPVVALNDNKG